MKVKFSKRTIVGLYGKSTLSFVNSIFNLILLWILCVLMGVLKLFWGFAILSVGAGDFSRTKV